MLQPNDYQVCPVGCVMLMFWMFQFCLGLLKKGEVCNFPDNLQFWQITQSLLRTHTCMNDIFIQDSTFHTLDPLNVHFLNNHTYSFYFFWINIYRRLFFFLYTIPCVDSILQRIYFLYLFFWDHHLAKTKECPFWYIISFYNIYFFQ
jgi:hypothetical protein